LVPLLVCIPETTSLVPDSTSDSEAKVLFWGVIASVMSVYNILIIAAYTTMNTIINNTVRHDKLGGVNGLAQSMISLFRTSIPTIASNMFAWSINQDHYYVISFRLGFVISAAIFLFAFFMSISLPRRLNKPFVEYVRSDG